MALESGMDVKTLSALIGHESAETTLNVYSHVTDRMQEQAAQRIDAGIVHAACDAMSARVSDDVPSCDDGSVETESAEESPEFVPYRGQIRCRGTGCVSKINEHLWEGRYSPRNPDGTRDTRNVYAHSEEECEQKLAELIRQMKVERAAAEAARR